MFTVYSQWHWLSGWHYTPKVMSGSLWIFLIFMWAGPDERKKWLHFVKDLHHILDTKTKSQIFRNAPWWTFVLYECFLVECGQEAALTESDSAEWKKNQNNYTMYLLHNLIGFHPRVSQFLAPWAGNVSLQIPILILLNLFKYKKNTIKKLS